MVERRGVCAEIERLARTVEAWGCTAAEIAGLEADQGLVFPEAYRCFLMAMGRDAGGCFDGSLVTYPYVLGSRVAAINLLEANREESPDVEVFRLPEDALVISLHDQGYAFMFIRITLGDDAPVEMWTEGSPMDRTTIVDASFLEHVLGVVTHATAPRWEQRRREHKLLLRRAFDPPSCPLCHADWSAYAEVQGGLPNASRVGEATFITCRQCLEQCRWWWGSPAVPLRGR